MLHLLGREKGLLAHAGEGAPLKAGILAYGSSAKKTLGSLTVAAQRQTCGLAGHSPRTELPPLRPSIRANGTP